MRTAPLIVLSIAALTAGGCTEPNPDFNGRPPSSDGGGIVKGDSRCPTLYFDGDHDGFGDAFRAEQHCGPIPPGFVARAGDCADADERAFPGQQQSFATPRFDGSWDFDCDGRADVQPPHLFGGCKRLSNRCEGQGWAERVPSCGQSGIYVRCVLVGGDANGKDGSYPREPRCEPQPDKQTARCR